MNQIVLCQDHIRSFSIDWFTNDPSECYRCVYGKYPDWEMRGDYPFDREALEKHVARLLAEQYTCTQQNTKPEGA
jgi:hypothetical protein